MDNFILILAAEYIFINVILLIIFKRIFDQSPGKKKELDFSIVIAAKNENHNLPNLITSLKSLFYSKENYEVIIVDDNSTDGTFETGKALLNGVNNISIIKGENKILPGKKGALQTGISNSANPFILITDADCLPEKNWISSYSLKFNYGYDLLFGPAPFYQEKNFISQLSCFENLRSTLLTFTSAKIGLPYSAAARNFGFIRSAFEKIKGYSNTMDTLSGDDDLLLREAIKNNLKIEVVAEKDSFVYSAAKKNLKEYLKQKRRHTKTSFYYLPGQMILPILWHLINFIFLISPLLYFINPFFLLLFFTKVVTDFFIVTKTQKFLNYKFKFYQVVYLQLFYEFFLIIHFFNALFFKTEWK